MSKAEARVSQLFEQTLKHTETQFNRSFLVLFSKKNLLFDLLRRRHAGHGQCLGLAGGQDVFVEVCDGLVE